MRDSRPGAPKPPGPPEPVKAKKKNKPASTGPTPKVRRETVVDESPSKARIKPQPQVPPQFDSRGRKIRRRYLMHDPQVKRDIHGNQIVTFREIGRLGRTLKPTSGKLKHPLVSIVIPAYGQPDLVSQCVSSVRHSIRWECYEMIVVDDRKPDASVGQASAQTARLLKMPARGGFAAACNHGAKHARGKYLVFLNTDCVCRPNWVEALVRWFKRLPRDVGAVAPRLLYPDGLVQHAGMRPDEKGTFTHSPKRVPADHPDAGRRRWVPAASASCLAMSAHTFRALGGFSAEYPLGYYEDVDLLLRMQERFGLGVLYDPDSTLVHFEGRSSGPERVDALKRAADVFRERWPKERINRALARAHEHRTRERSLASVVVTVRDAPRVTRRMLRSLADHTEWRPLEVVVCDDESNAHTVAVLDEECANLETKDVVVKRLRNVPALGYLKNANRGFEHAAGEWVCLCNSDIAVTPWWLTKMIHALAENPKAMVCNPMLNKAGGYSMTIGRGRDAMAQAEAMEFASLPTRHRIVECVGSCFLMRRKVMDDFRAPSGGVFDEYYDPGYGEETDLCMRVNAKGFHCVLTDDTFVFHRGHASFARLGAEFGKISHRGWQRFMRRWKPKYEAMSRQVSASPVSKIEALSEKTVASARTDKPAVTVYLHSTILCGGTLAVTQILEQLQWRYGWRTCVATAKMDDWEKHPYAAQALVYGSQQEFIGGFVRDPDAPGSGVVVATLAITPPWVVAAIKGQPYVPVYFVQGDEMEFRECSGRPAFKPWHVLAGYDAIPRRICNSRWTASRLESRGFGGNVIIPVGYDPDTFYPRPKASECGGKLTVASAIAPGTQMHDYPTWLKVCSALRQRYGQAVDIVCYGHDLLANENRGLFRYVGKIPPHKVGAIVAAADVAVDCSRIQGFGLPGIEAMACGTALVVTDCGGVNEYARSGENCRMAPVGAPVAIADHVAHLLEHVAERRRLVTAGLKTAKAFTWYKIAGEWDRQLRKWLKR